MSEPVRASRVAVIAGLLVALYVVVTFLVRPVPDGMVALLGGPDGGIERVGGLRVTYRPAPGTEAALEHVLAHRAHVRRDNGRLLLEFPGITEDTVPAVTEMLVAGGLQMKEVVETDYAQQIGESAGVQLELDQWRPDDGGAVHTNGYLRAYTTEDLDRAIAAAVARGWALPEGHELAFELVEPDAGADDPRPYWRSYELASEVLVDGSMIASAMGAYDPNTNRPIVLLDFTDTGGQRFCDVTARIAGKKLATVLGGRIRSAPIINGQICGGRASITMGGSDPAGQALERDALVAVLSQGALPPGGTIEAQTWTPPADVATQEWIGRLLLGLGAGGGFGLVTLLVLRWARPRAARRWTPGGRFPWRRLAVTLLGPAALIIGAKLTLPGLDEIAFEHVVGGELGIELSVLSLGVGPIIAAFMIVEIVALLVPSLRWRRHDPIGRVRLGQAVAMLALVAALVQGFFVATYLESLGRLGGVITIDGWNFRLVVMLSLATGTMLLAIVAGMIREHGLGNGYGVLLASAWLIALASPFTSDPSRVPHVLAQGSGLGVITMIAIVLGTASLLRWRVAGGDREPALRGPTSGMLPINETMGLLYLTATLSALGLGEPLAATWRWIGKVTTEVWLVIPIAAVLAWLWSWLLSRPAVVERVAMQAGLARPARITWARATMLSGWFVVAIATAWKLAAETHAGAAGLADPISWMIVTAVVLDVVADARAHRTRLVAAGILHQIQYAGVIERVLADAGIPHHIHASHLRTLLAFFGPFAPAVVMVPAEHGDAARVRLEDVLRQARSRVPPARVLDSARDAT